jgi:cyclopropane-fatty-acyl-phospholipid synthase
MRSYKGMQSYIPIVGDLGQKHWTAYYATRGVTQAVNAVQMALAEAYANGLELPDPVLRTLFDISMPVLFKHFPSLLAPYEWVLKRNRPCGSRRKRAYENSI